MASRDLQDLEPRIVWAHFATLCAIPRASLREAALRQHLIAWAQARGIGSAVDGAGNLILSKAASPGCEALPGVILQGHLDMVCQANAGTAHDFERDPIRTVVRDGWLIAEETTLGADNGIGVALALAALEQPGLVHPPLEVLLTVNEESGMDGARGLAPGTLRGRTLINLDTEEWGYFYLGCAGGVDVEVRLRPGGAEPSGAGAGASHLLPQTAGWAGNVSEVRHECAREHVLADYVPVRFDVSGLRGGHSGIDIHLGRGNAIKLLAEALRDLAAHSDVRLIEMSGGTARNAIPREAYALCALPSTIAATIDEWVRHRRETWRQRLAGADAGVMFACEHFDTPEPGEASTPAAGTAIANTERDRLLAFLDVAANGVARVSEAFPGVTDTSSNLGVLVLDRDGFKATFKVRALEDARAEALADRLVAHAASYGLQAWKDGAYPGWTPNPSSALLALCRQVYAAQFGTPAGLQVIHAGLECGLLAASHPHLDMISFGPDIRGAHAPGEAVEIESVARCWQLLKAVLHALGGHSVVY
ncbi:MAG: M20/M25/M40 family metallo-hydrolase [Gallionella sp.]|nr:M20/M25/M40 family metallo-hydrolase [Gallionella sp.]